MSANCDRVPGKPRTDGEFDMDLVTEPRRDSVEASLQQRAIPRDIGLFGSERGVRG
jgi:hypothetical protein